MNDITRLILTLLVNDSMAHMTNHTGDFLNGEHDESLFQARNTLAALQETVQEHIDYRRDMNARNDEQFMEFTDTPSPAPFGAPENDIQFPRDCF
jgi:hypothetical protein